MHDLWQKLARPGRPGYADPLSVGRPGPPPVHCVLCMTEVQADFYWNKDGISPELLPHTVTPQARRLPRRRCFR